MIFVSYSWENQNPDKRVLALINKLRKDGHEATCDIMYIQQRTAVNFPELMACAISSAEKVIVVLSAHYKNKADSFKGGVGQEYRYIITDIENNKSKYILVSFEKDYDKITPEFLKGREIILLCDEDKYSKLYYRITGVEEYAFCDVNSCRKTPEPKKVSEMDSDGSILNTQTKTNYIENRKRTKVNPLGDISILVSAYAGGSPNPYDRSGDEFSLEYVYKRDNDALNIEPSMEYLKKCKNGRAITQISYLWEPFSWNFPRLDFKVTNNSNKTLYITDIVFKNISSCIDPSPVLIMLKSSCSANARHIYIENDGWGDIKNLRLKLSANPVNSKEPINFDEAIFTHELFIGDIEKSANVDISSVLKDYGFITDLSSMAPLEYGGIWHSDRVNNHLYDFSKVYGEFIYEGLSYAQECELYNVKFEAIVYLYDWSLPAMPPPPSYFYKVKFETDCKNYSVYASVSQALEPKRYDRFVITIGLDKSSYHEFEIEVVTNLGIIALPAASLLAFVPRSGARFIEDGKRLSLDDLQ